MAAAGQPFLLNTVSKLAFSWFGDKERAMATAIGSMSMPLGMLFSFILPSMIFDDSDKDNKDEARSHFKLYLLVQTIIISVFCIPAIIFLRETPLSPPSVLANNMNEEEIGIMKGIKMLVRNKSYMLLFITFNLMYGNYSAMGAILSTIT